MRFIALALAALLAGCSVFSNLPDADDIYSQYSNTDDGYAYGFGVAATKEEALNLAQSDLAQQISVSVYSEFTSAKNIATINGKHSQLENREEVKDFIANYTSVQLQGFKQYVTKVKQGWSVRIQLSDEDMTRERLRIANQAPALAYALLIADGENAGTAAGELLSYAIRGLQKVKAKGLNDEPLVARNVPSGMTFQSFFIEAIDTYKQRLSLLPIREGNNIRFAVIDKDTYAPQARFTVLADGKLFETNRKGISNRLPLSEMHAQILPILVSNLEALNSDYELAASLRGTITDKEDLKEPEYSYIYVHATPQGSQVILKSGSDEIQALTAPAKFRVPTGTPSLTVHIKHPGNTHRDAKEVIGTASSPNYYINAQLTENTFGSIDLNVPSNSQIRLTNTLGEVINSNGNRIKADLEVGKYRVLLSRINNEKEDFQLVTDSFRVFQDQNLIRKYKAPIDREYYLNGRFIDLTFGITTKANQEKEFKLNSQHTLTTQDIEAATGSSARSGLEIGLRTMKLTNSSLAFSLGANYRTISFEKKNRYGDDDDFGLSSFGAAVGVGFWTSKLGADASWLTANYDASWYMWDSKSELFLANKYGEVKDFFYGYPFLDLGMRWEIFGFGLRLADPKDAASSLYVSIGSTSTHSGYRYQREVEAQSGIHY